MSRIIRRTVLFLALVLMALPEASARAQEVTFASLPAMQVTTPIPQRNSVPNDFNGDGLSEILFYNPYTSQLQYWTLNTGDGNVYQHVGTRTFNISAGYYVGATGDLNGDGLTDIVFTSASRDIYLWTNNGQGGFQSTLVGSYPAGWILLGAGDVDGDGSDDLLWFNADACQFAYWLMKGNARIGSRTVSVTCGYKPLSIGYYSLTNRLSIVWAGPQRDMWVWDSIPSGFASYSLGSYDNGYQIMAFGGGMQGGNMSLTLFDGAVGVKQDLLTRTFGINGGQTSYTIAFSGDGGGGGPDISGAGFIARAQGTNKTGVMYLHGAQYLEVCPASNYLFGSPYMPSPMPGTCPHFPFENGWFVVGAGSASGMH